MQTTMNDCARLVTDYSGGFPIKGELESVERELVGHFGCVACTCHIL
jgi:hypothetical protein